MGGCDDDEESEEADELEDVEGVVAVGSDAEDATGFDDEAAVELAIDVEYSAIGVMEDETCTFRVKS